MLERCERPAKGELPACDGRARAQLGDARLHSGRRTVLGWRRAGAAVDRTR